MLVFILLTTLSYGVSMSICQKCSSYFPQTMVIDGKRRSLNSRRFCLDCSPFLSHNTRDLLKQKTVVLDQLPEEKKCARCCIVKPALDFYTKRKKSALTTYCKSCTNLQCVERQNACKLKAVEYKGGCCEHCGYKKYLGALEFHHTDPTKKDFGIASASTRSFQNVKAELDKCLLLCANCHREEHARLKNLPN